MISPSVALSLCLAVWGLTPSQPPPPTPSVAAQEEQQLSSGNANNSATSQPDVRSGQLPKEGDKKSAPDWVARFTGMLALLAFGQLVAMIAQATYMRHAMRDGSKTAEAAKQSADAATQSMASLKVFNRARIRIDNVTFIDVEKPEADTFIFSHDFANVGSTNGHIFEQLDSICVHQGDLPDAPPYTPPESQNYGVSPQGAIQWKSNPISKSAHQIDRVLAGQTTLYAFGFVRYRDEFGDNHETRYAVRFRMNGELPALVPKAGYNDAT